MWTPTRLWPKLLRKHYLFIVIAIAISLAGLLFHYASEFSDSLLFYMKLLSFSTTALLGVIGIMVDFKDDEKKLTVAGKLNLVGLVFVAVVGVAAQRAEAVKSARSSAETISEYKSLAERSERTLRQVNRGLEPLGDTISLWYWVTFPLDEAEELSIQTSILDKARNRSVLDALSDVYIDRHTEISTHQPGHFDASFDEESPLMPKEYYSNKFFQAAPFDLEFYEAEPYPQFYKASPKERVECEIVPSRFLFFWDRSKSIQHRRADDEAHPVDGVLEYTYMWNSHEIMEISYGVFSVANILQSSASVLDFSGLYGYIDPYRLTRKKLDFTEIHLEIGHRSFTIPSRNLIHDNCGGITFKLAQLDSASENPVSK